MKCFIFIVFTIGIVAGAKYNGPTNQAGLNIIKEFEGFRNTFYRNPNYVTVVGYGHACNIFNCYVPINGKYSLPLTEEKAEELLKDDLKLGGYEACVANMVTYEDLNENQFSALVSFAFNLGCRNLRNSALLWRLNRGDVRGAGAEFSGWVYARYWLWGRYVVPFIVQRRAAERNLFLGGEGGEKNEGGSGEGSGGKGSKKDRCIGVTLPYFIYIRGRPSTSFATSLVHSLPRGTRINIIGKVKGATVNGDNNWFEISHGFVPACYVYIQCFNGADYCSR